MTTILQLTTDNILNVSFQTYDDFVFIVNGEEFKTSRIVSDLLSPKIRQQHLIDPTINEFTIDTKNTGDFSRILNLINFSANEIPPKEIPFVTEILEKLEQNEEGISLRTEQPELTINNVIEIIKFHEENRNIYSKNYQNEIEFISSHFIEFLENQENKITELLPETIELIISHPKLKLTNEDQLLTFVNELYLKDTKYKQLYNYVQFSYVESNAVIEFLKIFDINDISNDIWRSLSNRLSQQVIINDEEMNTKRYANKIFKFESDEKFNGIINYLRSTSEGKIENKINITASSTNCSGQNPINSILYERKDNFFASKNEENSWICYEFKDHLIIPSDYTIRSPHFSKNVQHPRSWVIEGSKDSKEWSIIDEQKNCSLLNGPNFIHTFHISKFSEIKFIRIRETGQNWYTDENYNLVISAFEIYGTLI